MQASATRAKVPAWARLTAVIAAGLAGTVSVNATAWASSTGGLQGKSAKQVWALAVAAAHSKGSVHFVLEPFLCCGATNVFGRSAVVVTDAGQSEGQQTISSGNTYGHATILVVPGAAYIQGDSNWTALILSFPSSDAGQWVVKYDSTPAFQNTIFGLRIGVFGGVTLGGLVSGVRPTGHLTLAPQTTIKGNKVVGVSGGLVPTSWPDDVKGSAVIYISARTPHLPVEAVYHVTENRRKTTVIGTFSKWGQSISVSVPANTVPYPH